MPRLPTSDTPATDWRSILALFLGSRLLIWLVAGISLHLAPKGSFFTPPATMADWFMHWDAAWYLGVAEHGYYFTHTGDATNVVFFPLFPVLMRAASLGGLLDLKLAGYLVSLGCLWTACVWLWRAVACEWNDARLATVAVAFLAFCPVGLFFSCLYSEGLFLMLAIGCIDSARRGRWWLAGALGALAALTRFIGVMFVVPLLWQYWESHRTAGRRLRDLRLAPLAACLLPLAGMALYCGFMWVKFGDPLIYFHGQEHWGRRFNWFWRIFARASFSGQALFYQVWFFAAIMSAFGLLAIGVWRRMPVVYAVFGLVFGFIYISSRFVEGQPRFFSVIFPLYVVLALIATRWPRTKTPLFAVSISLQALSVVLFVNGYWFT
jgi:Gpi18-like mannosyltransferase